MNALTQEIEEYLFYCQYQKELDQKTIKAYRIDLNQLFSFLSLESTMETIEKEDMNRYLYYLHATYKQKTVKRKIASTKAYYSYLIDEERIAVSPYEGIKTRFREEIILPRTIPRDTIQELLRYLYMQRAKSADFDNRERILTRDIAVIEMLFATGLRISELCHLRNDMFDMREGVLCIKGKGAKERYLQIENLDVMQILKQYKTMFQKEIEREGYFFVNKYGRQLSEQSARQMIAKHVSGAAIELHITPHMFRHSFATLLLEEDVDIRYIQKMLGHSSIVTTQIYTYVASGKQREILRLKHPRNQMQVGIM
ncbi:MAG: tyrosine-type recombinase/integrase [bacterium]|nr:tyrosine-type recombinase/integrase [bacterium]